MKSKRRDYLWNSLGGALNAGQSVLVLMVMNRVMGLQASGLYSIAFATANMFLYLGNYGVRNVQVSDLQEQYSFSDYALHRVLTVSMMAGASAVFCLWNYAAGSYSANKILIVALMCLLKCVDAIEEVFEGRLQQKGRLDLAGIMMSIRLVVSIAGMIVLILVLRNLAAATGGAVVLAGTVVVLFLYVRREDWRPDSPKAPQIPHIMELMKICFPVCAANFLSFYMINAPKYAIDAILDESAQARYNFIAMPVFVIQLLGMFIYQPVLVQMTVQWQTQDRKAFIGSIRRILVMIAAIAAVCLAGAYLAGIPVLSLLYANDLTDLKGALLLILFGGVFLALNAFLSAVLTIIRKQNAIPLVYAAGAVLCFVFVRPLTGAFGILGGVEGFVITTTMVSLILGVLVHRCVR